MLQEGRLGQQEEKVKLNLIVRADVKGSLEAIDKELSKLDNPEVEVRVLQRSVGGVTLADVTLASASDAVIAAFNVIPDEQARSLADERDVEDYQTVYAKESGSVAAPTAGLHFTPDLLTALDAAGVQRETLTLHVGAGTFLPVKSDNTDNHEMHSEWFTLSEDAADRLNAAKEEGRRIIAVGTTALRALESAVVDGRIQAQSRETDIFLIPGSKFHVVDGLMTNFHLPKSTLFMLVSALAGLDRMQTAYKTAIETGYRFYSYGDSSLIWKAL